MVTLCDHMQWKGKTLGRATVELKAHSMVCLDTTFSSRRGESVFLPWKVFFLPSHKVCSMLANFKIN